MTIISSGYDGTVDEVQWAKMAVAFGAGQYGVVGPADWQVTAHPSTDKAVLVAPGTGWGPGVLDVSDAPVAVQCAALTSGTRWDLITAKRDWQPPGGVTTFSKVTGGAVKVLPARINSPGEQDEQPLALVQWTAGQTQPTAIVDLRCWAGNGGMFAKDDLARSYLDRIGSSVNIGGKVWAYQIGANDTPGWALVTDNTITQEGFVLLGGTNANGDGTYYFPTPFPNGVKSIQLTDNNRLYSFLGIVHYKIIEGSATKTGFNFRAYTDGRALANAVNLRVSLTARGW